MKLWPILVLSFVGALLGFAIALPTPPSLSPPRSDVVRCASDPAALCRKDEPNRPLGRPDPVQARAVR